MDRFYEWCLVSCEASYFRETAIAVHPLLREHPDRRGFEQDRVAADGGRRGGCYLADNGKFIRGMMRNDDEM
jgi:hypothetical protein